MKKFTTFFALALSATALSAQTQSVRWAIGSAADTDYGYSFHPIFTANSANAIIAGKSTSFPAFADFLYSDALLAKVDIANGVPAWIKTYRLAVPNTDNVNYDKSDIFWRTQAAADGGSISVGVSADSTALPSFGLTIVKTDASGTPQWSKFVTGNGFANAAYDVTVLNDGYVLAGTILPVGATQGIDMALAKFDLNGDVVWAKNIGTASTQSCRAMVATDDGGFMLAGAHVPSNAASSEILITKTNANGTVQWSKTYGGADEDRATSICTDGTNYYVGGFYKNGSGFGAEDMFVMAIDAAGTVLWKQIYGTANTDYVNGITQSGNSVFVTGYYTVTGNDKNAVLLELNKTTGTATRMRQFGGATEDQFFDALAITNNNIAVVGNTAQIDANNDMMFSYLITSSTTCNDNALPFANTQPAPFTSAAIALTSNVAGAVKDYPLMVTTVTMASNTLCPVATENSENQLTAKVFPNPTSGVFSVEIADNALLTLTDALGRTLKTQQLAAGNTTIETDNMPNGIYFVYLKNNKNASFVTKIVLNR